MIKCGRGSLTTEGMIQSVVNHNSFHGGQKLLSKLLPYKLEGMLTFSEQHVPL
jgi:hypothetical protein